MRRRPVLLLLLLFGVTLVGSGCWDRSELEETAYVLALGLDKGEESHYAVTATIALPDKMAGDKGGGEGKPFLMTTVEAPTVSGAMAMIDSYMNRQISLEHAKAIFIGEELARISGMHAMDELVRSHEARRTMFYIVTKGKAADFLDKIEPVMEKNPQRFIEQLTYAYRQTAMIPSASQVQTYVTTVNNGYSEPVTYYAAIKEEDEAEESKGKTSSKSESGFKAGDLPRKGGPNVEMIGGAAFRGEKMIGVLTGDEMRLILLLQDQFQRGYLSLPDPANPELFVSLEIHRGRPTVIGVDLSGDRPRIQAQITLEAELLAIQGNVDYTEPETMPRLEAAVGEHLERSMRQLVGKTQRWESDVMGLGRHVVKHFPTVDAWEAYDWQHRYKDAQFDAEVRVTLRRFGIQLSPPRASH